MRDRSASDVGRVLVTGASGFIGSALCSRLREGGLKVRGTLLPQEDPGSLCPGIEPVTVEPLGADTPWSHALAGVDAVIHLAGRVHVMEETVQDPLAEFRRVNVHGTARLAEEAARAGVRRLVFVSSIKVNGEETELPYSDSSPASPTDPYGISKWEAEQVLRRIEALTGLQVVVVRPTLVYGPGVKANFLKMLQAIQRGIPLPLGLISNRRSLIYLGNLVDALAVCAADSRAAGRTFLLSDGEDLSTPELVRRVAKALGTRPRLLPLPAPLMQLAGRLTGKSAQVSRLTGSLTVDSGGIRRELGWQPPFTVQAGLSVTADWYRSTTGGAA